MGIIFSKSKSVQKKCSETPGKHPGNTRETPRKGAFTNVFIQRSGFRKKTFLAKVQMEFRDNYANLWSIVAELDNF